MKKHSFNGFMLSYVLGFAYMFLSLTDTEFQDEVLTGLKAVKKKVEKAEEDATITKTQQQKLLENYEQLHRDTKPAMEELTKLKNAANDQAGVLTSMKRLELQLKREQRMAFGDPIQRICSDPEKRLRINAEVRRLCRMPMDPAITKGLNETDSPGTTFLNTDLSTELYDVLATSGKWNTLAVRTVGKLTTMYPIKTGRPVATFFRLSAGGKLVDDTNSKGSRINVTVQDMGALLTVSDSLLADSEIDISAEVLADFQEGMNFRMDYMSYVSNGTIDELNGGFTGVFNAGTPSLAAATHITQDTLTLKDWMLPLLTVEPVVLERHARWWMHQQSLVRTLNVQDNNKRPIFLTALEAPSSGAIGSILGYPVELVSCAPNVDAAGLPVAAFGDPNGQVVAVRKAFTFDESSEWKFDEVSKAFRVVGRSATGNRSTKAFAILKTAAQ